jgi:hypothetical protein
MEARPVRRTHALGAHRCARRLAGTITGRVVEARTLAPVAAASVIVVGTSPGALTDAVGRYRIEQVSSGSVTITVARIGEGEPLLARIRSRGVVAEGGGPAPTNSIP